MSKAHRKALSEYLSDSTKELYAVNYLAGKRYAPDFLTIYFYQDEGKERFMFSVEIDERGKGKPDKRAKVYK
jgi:hypothetical protein